MSEELFQTALKEVRAFYETSAELTRFMPFPSNSALEFRNLNPFHILPADLMAADKTLEGTVFHTACKALIALKDYALWRETYRGTNIGEDFLSRFGCYELLGHESHFNCEHTRGFVVYSDAGLYYPWHHHPAEEIYFILAGEAEFSTEGNRPNTLKPGDSVFHAKNQPHNMRTHEKGVLAWVQWRGDLTTTPVFTDRLNRDLRSDI